MESTPHFTNCHNYFGSMLVRHRCIEKMHGLVPDFSSSVAPAKSAVTPLRQSYLHALDLQKQGENFCVCYGMCAANFLL